jgi:hypothetical protein
MELPSDIHRSGGGSFLRNIPEVPASTLEETGLRSCRSGNDAPEARGGPI